MDAAGPPADDPSGLLIPISEAEAVVGELRRHHDPAAELGVPAHVTILFPFVAREAVDGELHASLGELFADLPPFAYRFSRVARFGDATVFLAPDPVEAFVALTRAVAERWPEYPPYEGAHPAIVPHLTIGDRLAPGEADAVAAAVAAALEDHGPIVGTATAVELLAQDPGARWIARGRYPLAG